MPDNDTKKRNEQLAVAARHAAGIGVGWFTLTLLARQLMDAAQKGSRQSYHDKLQAYANARLPGFIPKLQPSEKVEQLISDLGVGDPKEIAQLETKTASDKKKDEQSLTRKVMDKFINPVPVGPGPVTAGSLTGAFGNTGIHPAHIALTAAALLAGTAAGSAVSRKLSNKVQERELDERISKAKLEMDKLIAEEYQRTRGINKTAEKDGILEKGLSTASKLYLLYAAGVAALSYGVAKKYMDEADPNRARLGAIQELAKDRARMSGAPQILEDPTDPLYLKLQGKA